MKFPAWLSQTRQQLEQLRIDLSRPETLLPLAALGLLAGLLSGAAIVLFRLLVEGAQDAFLPGSGAENYEALELWQRLVLPILGAVLLALLFAWGGGGTHMLGIARVIESMAQHQGYLSLRGFVVQFVGAGLAIVSGHSVGREGPHVYIGAAASSLLGQALALPNNSVRTLVGCGTAAGIAASFNTPLAGVVFALEVVMMEYSVASFIPVMLAAVSANALSVAVFGASPAFSIPPLPHFNLNEIPLVVVLGLIAGSLSAVYVHLLQEVAERARGIAMTWRMLLAGLLVGLLAMGVPQVMGIGYDTVNAALLGELGALTLLVVVIAKLLGTSVCIGLGVPGGMIGPALFLGATLGSLVGLLAAAWVPGGVAAPALFALLGMGAMMGASLQAPLAALTAMMELTHSPGIVMPGMLVIVVANLTASELFGKQSLFLAQLRARGKDYDSSPMMLALRGIGVASVMNKDFISVESSVSHATASDIVQGEKRWLVILNEEQPTQLLSANELAKYLFDHPQAADQEVRLLEIPAARLQLGGISVLASLREAIQRLEDDNVEALFVHGRLPSLTPHVLGIVTREQIESAYRLPRIPKPD